MSNPSHLDFYWRPGCGFCIMLKRHLDKLGIPLREINIWEDAEAAEFVRSVANGNETVPTVHVGGTSLVNPSPREVLHLLQEHGPDLIPDGVDEAGVGRGRLAQFVSRARDGVASRE